MRESSAIDGALTSKSSISGHISVAFHQNAVPVVHEIALHNAGEIDISDIRLSISSEPAFALPLIIHIDRIAAGSSHHVRALNLQLDAGFLRKITEGIRGSLSIKTIVAEREVAEEVLPLHLFPPSHWGGSGTAPELLAAFVRPNDPAVDAILRDASSKLSAAGKKSAIDGYTTGSRQRAWELASAIWSAIASRNIAYVLPPASFEESGQKIRGPSDILDRRLATCLDGTLLFAACLEQANLNPVIVLTKGHAFIGLWLKNDSFPSAIVDDVQILRKRRDLEDIIFIETTLLTQSPPARFQHAIEEGAKHVDESELSSLEFALDVKRARSRGIRPIELGDGYVTTRPSIDEPGVDLGIDEAPQFVQEVVIQEEVDPTLDRLERWKRKLLDLTLRNKLLNFRDTKKGIELECGEPARLEDLLASGHRFKLMPLADVLSGADQRDPALFQQQRHDDGRRRFLSEALGKGEIHTQLTDKDLDNRLTELFRIARTAFEEGGSNVLFLALGFLKWTQKDGSKPARAPLILLPVSLSRLSVRGGFRLAAHEEDARINPTLLQMLRQDFKLNMPDFERELPADESGLDVARIWQIVRNYIRDMRGWELTSDVVLSTFSFTKFLMWKDLVDRVDILKRNPVVRHLIDTPKHTYGDGESFPGPESIDRHHPVNLFAPLSADSSQLAAVLAVDAHKDFVLFGPPGTGKSQTIANMISQCLAQGRTVLFVSQKTAALEVVQRRLRDIGLGEYCLEVHSTKAQKSIVLGQLKAAWHERSAPDAVNWEVETSELAKLRDELNVLVVALHRRRENGMTAHEAFGRVVATHGSFTDVKLDWGNTEHTPARVAEMRELIRMVRTDLLDIGDPSAHPLRGIGATEWSASWRRAIIEAADAFADSARALHGKSDALAGLIGLTVPEDLGAALGMRVLGQLLTHPDAALGAYFLGADKEIIGRALYEIETLKERAELLRRDLSAQYRPSVYREDLRALLSEWIAATSTNFLARSSRQKLVRQKLQPFALSAPQEDLGPELAVLIELRELHTAAQSLRPKLAVFGSAFSGLDTNTKAFATWAKWADNARLLSKKLGSLLAIEEAAILQHIGMLLTEYSHLFSQAGAARGAYVSLSESLDTFNDAQEALTILAGRDEPITASFGDGSWIEQSVAISERWKANIHMAVGWCHWNSSAARARAAGLAPMIDAVEQGTLDFQLIGSAFEAAYARWWTDLIMTADPILRTFSAIRHEDTIARFRTADEKVSELAKRIVRARLKGDIPFPTAFGTDPEWGTLSRELTRRAKHQPLRQLFAKLPTVLTKLTPCVMMSPLSIAQYLPPDSKPFDVVIFDEASQIPVWDAIGAIARGKQIVIAGDPEQLPPTSIGERDVDDIDDGIDVEDQESILDECLASNLPSRRLDWHYRSRSESLIAFSNAHYYNGRLVTFPSPTTEDRAVRYIHVPNGVYERGTARVNREEARVVVSEVVRRLSDPDFKLLRTSIGVVTFNGEQQRLIENLLDYERRSRPELDAYFDPGRWYEPVFVKNLENVQGDERDVILFSVAVAPDHTGRSVSTISSLNKSGGHRRLNVAITRARKEMIVFATLRPEQIDLSRTGARGVREFKHFLEFAERGTKAIAEAFAATGDGVESPFEEAVKSKLEARNWTVHTQIGVSSFRVDLGIVDPDAPGRYLAGVECDGATYHRSATARDRDRLRENILTQLGWRIRRVWSTDWWIDAERAIEKLHQQLLTDLETSRIERAKADSDRAEQNSAAEAAALQAAPLEVLGVDGFGEAAGAEKARVTSPVGLNEAVPQEPEWRYQSNSSLDQDRLRLYADAASKKPSDGTDGASSTVTYRIADLSEFNADAERFYDPVYRAKLRPIIARVIAVEGPIYEDVLVQRVARAHGFGRAASRIRETVLREVSSHVARTSDSDRIIYWPEGSEASARVEFRTSADGLRDHSDIPIPELASLANSFRGPGVGKEEVVRNMALYFNLARLREATRERFETAFEIAQRADA